MKATKAFRHPSTGDITPASVVTEMRYDGLGRRIEKAVQNSADLNCTYHFYYNGQQLVETRDGSDLVLKQYVWGLQYIDELVQIGVNDDPTDETEDDIESIYFAIHNANYNVQLVVDASGGVVERYEYDPYGQRQVFFSPGTNDPQAYAPTYISRRVTISSVDQPYGLCEFGHQGLFHDDELGLIYNRARMLHPKFGRFMQRDPLGYVDGMSIYEYQRSNSVRFYDPSGRMTPTPDIIIDSAFLAVDISVGAGAATVTMDIAALLVPAIPNPKIFKVGKSIAEYGLEARKSAQLREIVRLDSDLIRGTYAAKFENEFFERATNPILDYTEAEAKHSAARAARIPTELQLGYVGLNPNTAGSYPKHFLNRTQESTIGNDAVSKWLPTVTDEMVMGWIQKGIDNVKGYNIFKTLKSSEINGYRYHADQIVGWSKGECTHSLQIRFNQQGQVHAYPIPDSEYLQSIYPKQGSMFLP